MPELREMRKFQSTLPVWGATVHHSCAFVNILISIHAPRVGSDEFPETDKPYPNNFNPRSPCGERPVRPLMVCKHCGNISIHAPRVGSDARSIATASPAYAFQSTLPVWGATLRIERGL